MKIIYEPACKGLTHIMFNGSFIKIVANLNNNEELFFWGDTDHIDELQKEKFDNINLKFRPIKIANFNQKIYALINGFLNALKLKLFDIKYNSNELIVTNAHAHTLVFIKLLFPKKKITFVLHGQLEELVRKKSIFQLGYYNKFALEFKNNASYIRYCVLGDSIKKNLLKIVPSLKENVFSIEHPYSFQSVNSSDNNYSDRTKYGLIKIGTIGNASISKRSDVIFEIENYIKVNKLSKIELYHIGSFEGILIPETSSVKIPSRKGMLPRDVYENYIKALDYILFLYPTDSYKLTASGAIFDAIAYEKPIIALKNDYFEYIFNKIGKIGFLCDDVKGVENVILKIIEVGNEEYQEFIQKIRDSREFFSYKKIADGIRRLGLW